MGTPFKFELNDVVIITASGVRGLVIGRAEYTAQENSYRVSHQTAGGGIIRDWIFESKLTEEAVKP